MTPRKSHKLRTSICSIDSQKFVPCDESEVSFAAVEETVDRIINLCKQLWPSVLHETIDVQYLDEGTFNQIFVISCADLAGPLPDVVIRLPWEADSITRTVAILEYLGEFTNLKIPKVINWDATVGNALKHDYVILSRIPGRTLQSVLAELSQEQKIGVAKELAKLYQQMESITSPIAGRMKAHGELSLGVSTDNNVFIQPFGTESQEITDNPVNWDNTENGLLPIERVRYDPPGLSINEIMLPIYQRRMYEALNRRTPYEYLVGRFEPLQKMVQGMVDNELFESEDGHICLQHPDFFPRNIMVDFQPDPVITGVIDWDDANFVPRFAARIPPRWLWQTGWGVDEDHGEDHDEDHDDGYEEGENKDDDGCCTCDCGNRRDWNEEPLDVQGNEPTTPEDADIKKAFEEAVGENWVWEATSPLFSLARRLLQFSRRILYTQQDDDNIDEWKRRWYDLFPDGRYSSEHSEYSDADLDTAEMTEDLENHDDEGKGEDTLETGAQLDMGMGALGYESTDDSDCYAC